MKGVLVSFVYIVLTSYLIFGLGLFLFQRSVIYRPQKASANVNALAVSFQNQSQKLNGWVVHPDKSKAIIYYGGNAEAVEQNIPLYQANFSGHSVYFIPYRGYANNDGKPTEQALYDDALAIFDQLKEKHQSISIIGRSLGSGVATYVAVNREIEKLVLVTPYDSIVNVAKETYPFLPASHIVLDKFLSIDRAPNIKNKTLVIMATDDKTITAARTHNLLAHMDPKIVTKRVIDNTDHNNLLERDEYIAAIAGFIEHDE